MFPRVVAVLLVLTFFYALGKDSGYFVPEVRAEVVAQEEVIAAEKPAVAEKAEVKKGMSEADMMGLYQLLNIVF